MDLMWSRIYDVILKTLICGESHVMQQLKKIGVHRNNCFEVFGYDVLIDSDLKPWLVEVNLSPALATDFNLIGVKRFDRKKESINKMKNRMKSNPTMKTGIAR
jgi:hypothetical protein